MRSASLSDAELLALVGEPPVGRVDLRAQVAVRLIAEAGVPPGELARMSTVTAMRMRLDRDRLPAGLDSELEELLAEVGEDPYLLGGSSPLQAPGLRWLCRRFGDRRGVRSVTPERLRRTWLRRLAGSAGLAEAARRAGVSEATVRRQLRAETSRPGASASPAVGGLAASMAPVSYMVRFTTRGR